MKQDERARNILWLLDAAKRPWDDVTGNTETLVPVDPGSRFACVYRSSSWELGMLHDQVSFCEIVRLNSGRHI